jgi:DNA processing protein
VSGLDLSIETAERELAGVRPEGGADAEAYAAVVWSVITEPGDAVAGRVVAATGSAAGLAAVTAGRVPSDAGVDARDARAALARWEPRMRHAAVTTALALARRAGVRLVVPGDEEWPSRLADLGEHAPHALWVRGHLDRVDETPAVAVVGARAATGYGEHVAAELASGLAHGGVTVISGAAYGIDGAAHRAALAAGGRTLALLAGGADRPYPAGHSELIARIAATGAVIAETPCGTAPSKWRFLARNRLIAALSDATVVVEAGARSGSLNTAAHAAALGRPLGAVPGPVTSAASAGCHRVLREFDGVCVTGVEDVREMLGMATVPTVLAEGRTDELTRLLDAASTRVARSASELAARSGLSVAEAHVLIGIAAVSGDLEAEADGWRRAVTR